MRKWAGNLWLFTEAEFDSLPDGVGLTCIDGTTRVKGKDYIDMDTRCGHLAYGVNDPLEHSLAELFLIFKLSDK